jgi:hypothetical protein
VKCSSWDQDVAAETNVGNGSVVDPFSDGRISYPGDPRSLRDPIRRGLC